MTDAWFDRLSEGIVLISDQRVKYLNRAAADMLDVDAEQSVGLPPIAVLRDHRLEEVYHSGSSAEVETRGRRLKVRAFPGGLLLSDDSALWQAKEDARELLSVLSHELRTPVTTIQSALEALEYDLTEAQKTRFLSQAREEAARLVRLLTDLTVEVKPPRARTVLLSEMTARALSLLAAVLERKAIRVEDGTAGVHVFADPDKVLQVLLNLLENAALHGPAQATIHLSAGLQEDGLVRLEVKDEGEPLPAEHAEKLFELKTRGASVKAKGTGLGLYVVRSIAERWGGAAWLDSEGGGNTFVVTLPGPD